MSKLITRLALSSLVILLASRVPSQHSSTTSRLEVTPDGHYLQHEDGAPFFWLGDTAWYLFLRLTTDEIDMYLENRRAKGFNLIQAAILRGDLRIPNRYGEVPFQQLDPERPNERYFRLVDWTIQRALTKRMFIGLLPTWGDQVSDLFRTGSIRFNRKNAYDYGFFLGRRYRHFPNIVWILGGDQPAFTDSHDWRPVWRAMIKGVREGSGGDTLLTYHPWGEHSSSEFWGSEDILDLNMVQSGHARHDVGVWKWITRDFTAALAKPVLDGEPNYEDHPVNWKVENGYFRDYDVRKQLYRSVFSGACGVTYGHQAIRQFYSHREEPMGFPDRYWTEALDRPGAFQAGYLKRLILSRPPLSRVPDQAIIESGQEEEGGYITAFRDKDGSYAMVYLPIGREIEVNVSGMKAESILAWWFNPRNGEALKSGLLRRNSSLRFVPPTTGIGNDWVLVLDDAAKQWASPGSVQTVN